MNGFQDKAEGFFGAVSLQINNGAVFIRSDAVLPRKAVPANGSGKPAGAGNGYRENGYSQCENALGGGGVVEETLLQKGPSTTKHFNPTSI